MSRYRSARVVCWRRKGGDVGEMGVVCVDKLSSAISAHYKYNPTVS